MPLRALIVMLSALAAVLAVAWASAASTAAGTLYVVAAAGSATAVALALAFSRWVSRPIAELAETANRLAAGDLKVRVRPRRGDELGSLGRAVDRMADQLNERVTVAEREEARHRAILEAMVEAVVVTDREGRVVLSNAAFAALAGEPRPESHVIDALRSPQLHEAVRDAIRGVERRATVSITLGERTVVLDAAVAPLPGSTGAVAVLHDVTELRRTDAVRRDFVANASHELRTPLTSIKGFAETLEGGALNDPVVAPRFVRGIVENTRRLERLVDDLVSLSRAESPDARFDLVSVAVSSVAAKVIVALEARARAAAVRLALEPGGPDALALADERALDQVLMNLVENAIKYNRSGGSVDVRVTTDAEHVVVSVRDDGPGIAESHLPRIFERFYRVDAGRAREEGGTGLGLAIVKHLAHRMRGDVNVTSRLGKGTTFTVRLARVTGRPAGV